MVNYGHVHNGHAYAALNNLLGYRITMIGKLINFFYNLWCEIFYTKIFCDCAKTIFLILVEEVLGL